MDIHGPLIPVVLIVYSPDTVQDISSIEHFVFIFYKEQEQPEFHGCQIDFLIVPEEFHVILIQKAGTKGILLRQSAGGL